MVAPDLLGHGMAPSSTDYTLKTTAEAVLPLLSTSEPFDLVVGSSWGAIVALALLPHLPDSVRAVLVDPPMELAEEVLEGVRKGALMEMASVRTVEEEMEAHKCAKDDAVWRVLAKSLCRPSAVEGILQVINTYLWQRSFEFIVLAWCADYLAKHTLVTHPPPPTAHIQPESNDPCR